MSGSGGTAGAASGGPVERLRQEVAEAAATLRGSDGESPLPTLERPPRAEFGDYSTNVALLLAPALKAPPREIAERVGETLSAELGETLERVEVAGPGFLNVFLSDAWFRRSLELIRGAGERFGAEVVPEEERERILVEFVSANPTGPLTAASGRHAAYGDSLCRILELAGHRVDDADDDFSGSLSVRCRRGSEGGHEDQREQSDHTSHAGSSSTA